MNTEQFAYWLQGFAELNEQPPTPEQWQSIRDHLKTVFDKKTPVITTNNLVVRGGNVDGVDDLVKRMGDGSFHNASNRETTLVC